MSSPQVTTNNEEEDDWETADLTIAPPKKLRPTAPTFQPKPPAQASTSNLSLNNGGGQRIHAPPGGQWNVDKRAQRSEWEAKKAANANTEGDDWFGEGRGQSNRQLWDEANSIPPPTQITFSQTQQLPGPQIKILRRQAPSNSNSPSEKGSSSQGQGKTYAEKEEEYRLARERIFGGGSGTTPTAEQTSGRGTSPGPNSNSRGGTPPISRNRTPDSARTGGGVPGGGGNGNGVVRQPRGPGDGGGSGFGNPGVGGGVASGFVNGTHGNGVGQFPPGW